jgi:Prophage CP4-57 regulatory protein (AlpA)
MDVYLRFKDLKNRNIVRNWTTLKRLITKHGFPPGHRVGAAARGWKESEIKEWLKSRRIKPPTPP